MAAVPCNTLVGSVYYAGTVNGANCVTAAPAVKYTGNVIPTACGPSVSYNPTAVTQQLDNINPKPTSSFVGSAGSQIVVYAVPTNFGQAFNVGNSKLSFKAGLQTRSVSWTQAFTTANTVGAGATTTTVALTYNSNMDAVRQTIVGWGLEAGVCKFTAAATGTGVYVSTVTNAFVSTQYNLASLVPVPTATVTYGYFAGVAQIDATLNNGDYISSMYIPVDLTVPVATTMTTTSTVIDTSVTCSVVEEDFTVAESPSGTANGKGGLRFVLKCTPGSPSQYGIADMSVPANACSVSAPTSPLVHTAFSLQFAGHTTPAVTAPFVGLAAPFTSVTNLANGIAFGLFETNNPYNGNIPDLVCGQTYTFPITVSMCHVKITNGVPACDDGPFIDYRMVVSATATTACKISFQVAPDTLSLTLEDPSEPSLSAQDEWVVYLRSTSGNLFTAFGITDNVGLELYNTASPPAIVSGESLTAIPLNCFGVYQTSPLVTLTPTTQVSITSGKVTFEAKVMDPLSLGNTAANAAACKFVVPNAARSYKLTFKFKLYSALITRRDAALVRRADEEPTDRSMSANFRIDNAAPAAASVGASVGVVAGAASAAVVACAVVIGALVVVRKRNLSQKKKHEALPSSEMFVSA
ncbi:hypothetical protein HDU81_002697 [Chytriomyces hyalinus]|nr:hypothetical protein HDU81_002697 [Chytriomyces hyalinus]